MAAHATLGDFALVEALRHAAARFPPGNADLRFLEMDLYGEPATFRALRLG